MSEHTLSGLTAAAVLMPISNMLVGSGSTCPSNYSWSDNLPGVQQVKEAYTTTVNAANTINNTIWIVAGAAGLWAVSKILS